MNIKLSDSFSYKRLIQFTLPSVAMMVFTSIYGVVDGFFVSNYAGKTAFAAVNLIMPFLMLLGTVGFMFGTGGSALVAKYMGQGRAEKANRLFSLFVYFSAALGTVISILAFIFIRPIAVALGADGAMLQNCVLYGRIIISAAPAFILQQEFQSFFVTAQKPTLGLIATVVSGVTNMVLDALFVGGFGWGIAGAAAATALSQLVGAVIPLCYFFRKNNSPLRLGKTGYNGKALLKAAANGSSELMSNVSMSLVNMLYNFQLMKYAGENGVASYGVLMYVNFVFIAVFIGYSIGMAPVVSFHFGAGNHGELRSLRRKSFVLIGGCSVAMLLLAELFGTPLARFFVGYDAELLQLTACGFQIFSFSFLFAGLSIFGSAFFTALNDGLTSALISFLRTLVFQVAAVLLLPLIFGINGIWFSVVAAELVACAVSLIFIADKRKKYGY